MTKILPKRKHAPRSHTKTILLVLGALCMVALIYFFRAPLSSVLHSVMTPVYTLGRSLSASVESSFDLFSSKEYLIGETHRLSSSLEEARLVALDRNLLYEENLALKERLDRLGDPYAILATVVLKPPFTPYDTLLIDVGERDGVSEGDKVAAIGTVLVGYVREVYTNSARVVLFSTPGEKHEGYLEGIEVPITIEGQGGGSMRARVPYGIEVAAGTVIAIPSISGGTVGVIEHLMFTEGDAYTEVYLRLPVNPFSLTHVDVWRKRTR